MKIRLSLPMTRVEGSSELVVQRDGENVTGVSYRMPTARDFEGILVGQRVEDLPKIVARICGICPVAHRIAAAKAVEAVVEAAVPPAAELLRELALLGEVVRSHTYSVFFSTLPDLMDLANPLSRKDILGIDRTQPKVLPTALRFYRCAEELVDAVAGNANMAFNIVPGGVVQNITPDQQQELVQQLNGALPGIKWAKNLYSWLLGEVEGELAPFTLASPLFVSSFDTQVNRFYGTDQVELLSLGGTRLTFPCHDFPMHLAEASEPDAPTGVIYRSAGSSATPLLTGPHARLAALRAKEGKHERTEIEAPNLFQAGLLRLDEMEFAITNAIHLLERDWEAVEEVYQSWQPRTGIAGSAVEAPRGTLLYLLNMSVDGKVKGIQIRVPSEINAESLSLLVSKAATICSSIGQTAEQTVDRVKMVIRCFDPCVSCTTHSAAVFRQSRQPSPQLRSRR
jgi:coenzyme F420-reducing hydrogenase alpha subunit